MGKALRLFINWLLKAFGAFVIVATWLGYFGLWEEIGGLSLDFVHENLSMAIALTIGGIAVIFIGSSVMRFFE